ncbi:MULTISPECIES: PAQR family membrane homeostasis protein TrhA [Cytobacillus]|uniref:Hemolysin III family protein n=1 Tax=Cytobacillus pseudoceanisediminis TaxID=3051614 RepID=A0ABZ2ZPP8_9BACI|nr:MULTISPECIES: hemolysin III family protein [Cytobacillus]MBY0156244.1 hemolysin III family protein [Cytobacillus firmus]MCM3244147.1 hemolysin III family protein [Cytobacillus oceanisediminis]MCM3392505.1 hemolysin III family protein [Cytobacillus oceanisediminis]MCM3530887.1 hemolysin III family protein [Cytobacillus oceanisediminis]MCS0674044.1 hemolysin III family protein [Cytobacillus firmus]
MNSYIREPINGLTHLAGAILSFAGLLAMVIKASLTTSSPLAITAVAIFGISLMLLYSASATYHMVIAKDKVIAFLRKLDHSMIYVLIAGSYTPFCLITLNGVTGWVLFSIVSAVALSGILFKMIWFSCPRWLSTALYIAMGWIIVFAFSPLSESLSSTGVMLLLLGGILYTVGGVIYAIKPKFLEFKHLGFHEIFHIFIMMGSMAHFLCVFMYVI